MRNLFSKLKQKIKGIVNPPLQKIKLPLSFGDQEAKVWSKSLFDKLLANLIISFLTQVIFPLGVVWYVIACVVTAAISLLVIFWRNNKRK